MNNSVIIPNNTFQTLNQEVLERDFSKNIIPSFICKFSPLSTWHVIQLDEIIQKKIEVKSQNLYFEDILIKKHNPNLIFENVSKIIDENQFFAFRIITAENIKQRLQSNLPLHLLTIYYPFHFFFRRVLPKTKGFRKISRLLNIPIDVSKSEILGRLIYNGFNIVSYNETDEETIIIAKVNFQNNPSLTKTPPSEGLMFKMVRMGKNAKNITVYKFRSMHPYAEYVQEYIHNNHGLDIGGKFKDDFRVSTGGRIIRKYWIDELPMIYNLIKGDIKLIGVRPISEHYFNLYPDYLKELRVKTKPGLLPPFYADMPKTFQEIVDSEMTYLHAYQKAPLITDFKYLMRILNNIFIKRARSQ
ncbi:sugar transferase [Emticicia sp.]|uniref:sugar transferase n=1 Tax=Emticicia sp. TaxID=1930953 RepID=UPI0037515287